MDQKNKNELIKDLKISALLFWVAFSVITSVYCWNSNVDAFIVISSLISTIGAVIMSVLYYRVINNNKL